MSDSSGKHTWSASQWLWGILKRPLTCPSIGRTQQQKCHTQLFYLLFLLLTNITKWFLVYFCFKQAYKQLLVLGSRGLKVHTIEGTKWELKKSCLTWIYGKFWMTKFTAQYEIKALSANTRNISQLLQCESTLVKVKKSQKGENHN